MTNHSKIIAGNNSIIPDSLMAILVKVRQNVGPNNPLNNLANAQEFFIELSQVKDIKLRIQLFQLAFGVDPNQENTEKLRALTSITNCLKVLHQKDFNNLRTVELFSEQLSTALATLVPKSEDSSIQSTQPPKPTVASAQIQATPVQEPLFSFDVFKTKLSSLERKALTIDGTNYYQHRIGPKNFIRNNWSIRGFTLYINNQEEVDFKSNYMADEITYIHVVTSDAYPGYFGFDLHGKIKIFNPQGQFIGEYRAHYFDN